jgi:hypothetical protein
LGWMTCLPDQPASAADLASSTSARMPVSDRSICKQRPQSKAGQHQWHVAGHVMHRWLCIRQGSVVPSAVACGRVSQTLTCAARYCNQSELACALQCVWVCACCSP